MNRFLVGCVSVLVFALVSGGPSPMAQPATPAPVQAGTGDLPAAENEPTDGWPRWTERWLFNADERTRQGRAAAEADRAVERFDTALRLRPDDPATRFNAGTARLRGERPGARELLQAAANEAADSSLRSRARYNLGNAQLEASDLAGAVESYQDALRADPSFADAKHNLEVALRRLQEQEQNQDQNQQQDDQQQDDQQQDDQQEQEQESSEDEDDQEQQQSPEGEPEENEDESRDPEDQEPEDQEPEDQEPREGREESPEEPSDPRDAEQDPSGEGQSQPEESPLPQFEDLPDMSAEEAAAILEAIENMEREERREQALEAARRAQASGKKDW